MKVFNVLVFENEFLISLGSSISLSSCTVISIKFLNNTSSILNDLWITVWNLLGEWINNVSDSHLFEFLPTLLVHAEVSNREESNSSW